MAGIPIADLFVIPAESHLMWFSSYNEIIEEKMRAFLRNTGNDRHP
jgi:hypothetical protein